MTIERPMFPPVDTARRRFLSVAAGDGLAPTDTAAQAIGTPAATDMILRVGPLELDLVKRTARRGDRSFDLLPREFRLLEYMMQRCGQLLTRAALLKDVWHYNFVPETNTVDVHLCRLRRKVDGSNEAPMIRTVRSKGRILMRPTS